MNYYPNYQNPYSYGVYVQQPTINGKIVDGIEVVKSSEIPMGSYGVFPKADMTSIFVKAWNPDGTTRVITYVPQITNDVVEKENSNEIIMKALANLDKKIDALKPITPKKKREDLEDE